MLVRAFGLYWSITGVEWAKAQMLGVAKGKKRVNVRANVWREYGIYCLYDEYVPIYVGRAYKKCIGERLAAHLKDRLAGRWDSFSWFGVNGINADGSIREFNQRLNTRERIVKSLESFAIIAFDPRLNRRHERIAGADEFTQVARFPKATRTLVEEMHKDVKTLGKRLRFASATPSGKRK